MTSLFTNSSQNTPLCAVARHKHFKKVMYPQLHMYVCIYSIMDFYSEHTKLAGHYLAVNERSGICSVIQYVRGEQASLVKYYHFMCMYMYSIYISRIKVLQNFIETF